MSYQLIDSGNGQKLEQFGPYIIARPAAQAVWLPQQKENTWKNADALFTRDGSNRWISANPLPQTWTVEVENISFKISPTDFGHLGIFPEQQMFWRWMTPILKNAPSKPSLLNLFAYSGGVTLAAAKAGADVCHLDASKPMVAWARENASLNKLDNAPIRWIVDDVSKFLARELRRNKKYDAIVLDPPSFGRGPNGEVFKIEEQIIPLLQQCRSLLSDKPLFIAFSCHTPGFTPYIIKKLMEQSMQGLKGFVESGELVLETNQQGSYPLPSGTYAWWRHE